MAKILLVEDDKSLREIYGVRLLAEGYDIVSAGDGEEALAMAIKERPSLVVSDVMMPKISGFDMLDILRSTTETKDIKVIMMTALSSEDQRQRGVQLGADRYLVKSQVGIEDVVRTVHEVLGDAPMLPGAQNAFGSPVPSAVPRPAPTSVPARPEPTQQYVAPAQQQPQPVASPYPAAPVAPSPAPAPAPVPQPQVYTQPAPQPVAPAPQQPQPVSTLPQPTAPFSTARPAGLADRIIQPLEKPDEVGEPLASLMEKELGTASSAPQVDVPAAPAVPPSPPMPPVAAPPAPVAPSVPENHGISFEETPRQAP
jgi:CheY-like chemotaxis protein